MKFCKNTITNFIPLSNDFINKRMEEIRNFQPLTHSYVSFKSGSTVFEQESAYKTSIANRYHSTEMTDVTVKYCGIQPTYEDLGLVLYSIASIAKTDKSEPRVMAFLGGHDVEMSTNLATFLKELKKTNIINLSVFVGKSKTPFKFSVIKGDDRIAVTTRIYHPKDLSSSNVLNLLSRKINEEFRKNDMCRKIFSKFHTYQNYFDSKILVHINDKTKKAF